MKGVTSWYIRAGEWALNLFLLNVLWILFSALGLFAFGIFPATAAMFAVIRKLNMAKEDVHVFKLFWKTYKVEFMKSNLIGYIFLMVGFLLYVDLRVLQQLDSSLLNLILTVATFILVFLYLLTLLYVFPVFVHLNLKTVEYIKYAFILAIGKPKQSLLILLALAISMFLLIQVPGLIPVFGISIFSFILMKISSSSFPPIESTHN